jgi:hypothetical protein
LKPYERSGKVKNRLLTLSIVAVLALSVSLIGCTAEVPEITQYSLTISSTEGGSVTTPGEGTFTYDRGMVVNLMAVAEEGYHFADWTGDVSTIADTSATSTSITMNGHYFITASFEQIPPVEFGYGLVSWWRGEGDATDSWDDNDGVLIDGTTFATGKVGQAFQLDGLDDWVMVPSAPNLNFGTEDFTVCLWVNFADLDPEQIMIEKWVDTGDPPRIGWTFTKVTSSQIRLHLGPGSSEILDVAANITANTWHFAAVCRSGNTYKIYWDGTLIGSASWTETFNLDSDVSLKIGHRGNPDDTPGTTDLRNFYLKGLVDEVQIYSVGLSDADILYIFNNPGVPSGPVT